MTMSGGSALATLNSAVMSGNCSTLPIKTPKPEALNLQGAYGNPEAQR